MSLPGPFFVPALPPGACVGSMRMPPSKLAVAHNNESPERGRGRPAGTGGALMAHMRSRLADKGKDKFPASFFVRKDIHLCLLPTLQILAITFV